MRKSEKNEKKGRRKNLIFVRKRDGGKISFLRKRDGPLWINLKFFKDTEEYLDKQDAF